MMRETRSDKCGLMASHVTATPTMALLLEQTAQHQYGFAILACYASASQLGGFGATPLVSTTQPEVLKGSLGIPFSLEATMPLRGNKSINHSGSVGRAEFVQIADARNEEAPPAP
jgi:hypothetical protein